MGYKLSICIVNYRARDYLRDCLDSIYSSGISHPFEIIVIDNYSGDGSPEMIKTSFADVKLFENQDNLGYTIPMNHALRQASGEYLIQLNPDTLVEPDAFNRLVDYMDEHSNVGICTPKVLNRDGTLQKQCRRGSSRPWDAFAYISGLAKMFPKSKWLNGYLLNYLDDNSVHEVESVSGSCMFIRRGVVDQIGYLDESYFAYQEDADFCFRARKSGWKIAYVPSAQVFHFGGEGGSKVEVFRSITEWHRSYYRYYRKNLAKDYFFLLNWVIYFVILLKMTLSLAVNYLRKRPYAGSKKP